VTAVRPRGATLARVRPRLARCALLLAALLPFAAACGPRYARLETFDGGGLRVVLRSETRAGAPVPRGFDHPAVLASVRAAHILARLDVRMGGEGERMPVFPTVALYTVGEQLSRALAQATPDQEVVVQARRREPALGIFHQDVLTSFVAYVKGDDLVIHLAHVEWKVPKSGGGGGFADEEIPEPRAGQRVQEFEVLPAEGIVPLGPQSVAVRWRDPVFREPTHVRVGEGGRLLRRTVLMESAPAPEAESPEPTPLPADLPAETLRALADLQERRARGEISEAAYRARRRDLLRSAEDLRRAQEPAPAPPR